jgi:4-hydroxyacetophenone monooxygenase
MNHDWEITLAEANDQQLRDALAQAHIPALMGTLVHLRGNTDHFAEVRPVFELFGEEEDGLEEAQREQIRELAFISLTEYRDAGCPEIRAPSEADVVATMHAITGEPMQDEHIPLLREELNLFGEDRRRVYVGHPGRYPAATGGHPFPDRGEKPRNWRHLVREYISRVPG